MGVGVIGPVSQKAGPSPNCPFPPGGKVRKIFTGGSFLALAGHWSPGGSGGQERENPSQAENLPWLAMGRGRGRFWGRGEKRALETFPFNLTYLYIYSNKGEGEGWGMTGVHIGSSMEGNESHLAPPSRSHFTAF